MKNKKIYIVLAIIVVIIIFGCIITNEDKDNNKGINNSTIEDYKTKEIEYYKDNATINKFLNIYNKIYTDSIIDSEMLTVYNHHGSDHKDQVQFNLDGLQITLSEITKNEVSIFIDNVNNDTDKNLKNLTKKIVKVYNKDITDKQVEEYLNHEDTIQTHEGIEYQMSKKIDNNIIEYIKLTGNI